MSECSSGISVSKHRNNNDNCDGPVLRVTFVQKLAYWMTNVWVIILIFLIVLIIMIMLLYTIRPSVVMDNAIERIDNARLILTAFILASFVVIALWLVVQIWIRKLGKKRR